jgi:putative hemolysin
MSHPERIAAAAARPLRGLSVVAVPVVRLLGFSTEIVLRVLRVRTGTRPPDTEEEVKVLLKEGTQAGVFEPAEHDMIKRVFRLGDRRAGSLMTHAKDVVWLDIADAPDEIQHKITASPHSQFPVCEGTLDHVLGVVHVKDLLMQGFAERPFDVKGIVTVPLFFYEGMPGLKVLEMFKKSIIRMGIILDEYGAVQGVLTVNDIFEALVGDLPAPAEEGDQRATRRPDGSWLLDGTLSVEDFKDIFRLIEVPAGDYHTVAGLVLAQLVRIPLVADWFEWRGLRFEVVDMDGKRVDKLLVAPVSALGERVGDRAVL